MQANITAVCASLLAIHIVVLALRVVRLRRRERIGIGDGGNRALGKAIAAHCNAVENIPLAILMMFFYEIGGGDNRILVTAAAVLIIARLLNAVGVSQHAGKSFGRFYGTLATWTVTVTLAVLNLKQVLL